MSHVGLDRVSFTDDGVVLLKTNEFPGFDRRARFTGTFASDKQEQTSRKLSNDNGTLSPHTLSY